AYQLFLEIGPRPVLSGLGAQCLTDAQVQWLPSLKPDVDDWAVMLDSLGRLYVAGVRPDWAGFDQDYRRHRIAGLPTYPFQRRRFAYPLQTVTGISEAKGRTVDVMSDLATPLHGLERTVTEIDDWGYVPHWQVVSPATRNGCGEWL